MGLQKKGNLNWSMVVNLSFLLSGDDVWIESLGKSSSGPGSPGAPEKEERLKQKEKKYV